MSDSNGVLRRLDGLPDDLLSCPAEALLQRLGGPTLISIAGGGGPPLFLSVLLHGNELSGWNGLRRFLADARTLPRDAAIFIGNPRAAAVGLRTLADQQDHNRIWRGAVEEPAAALVREVRSVVDANRWFAAVDLHNNTGHNPHYAVLTDPTPENLGLARLLSDTAVLVEEPDTVLTRVFDGVCPAVTLELGPIADERSDERARDYVERCFGLEAVPRAGREEMTLFRSLVRVHVAEHADFAFADGDGALASATPVGPSLRLTGGVEGVNFHHLPVGFEFGRGSGELGALLRVLDVDHADVTGDFFELVDGSVRLTRPVTPAMYTTDPLVVRQDCLCYFMEPMSSDEPGRRRSA